MTRADFVARAARGRAVWRMRASDGLTARALDDFIALRLSRLPHQRSTPLRRRPAATVAEPATTAPTTTAAPVPKTLKGARVVTAEEAEPLWREKSAVFIDVYPRAPKPENLPADTVWRDPTHMSMEGAHWLPNVGYGVLSPAFEDYFRTRLATLTGGDPVEVRRLLLPEGLLDVLERGQARDSSGATRASSGSQRARMRGRRPATTSSGSSRCRDQRLGNR